MKIVLSVIAAAILCVTGWSQELKFEKQALELVQRTPVSTLESEMPKRRFDDWFKNLVGAQAGIIWQLSECDQGVGVREPGADLPVCVEANALLTDGRKVAVMVAVGTFKKGITGDPGFFFAVIEHRGQMYSFSRLRDLPEGINSPGSLKETVEVKFILSDSLNKGPANAASPESAPLAVDSGGDPPPPPPPSLAAAPKPEVRRISMGVLMGKALTKVSPVYPPAAKRANVRGEVQVLITISETGRVVDARAVSGNLLLRQTAVAAARQWVFNPSLLNGVQVSVQGIITFVFGQS